MKIKLLFFVLWFLLNNLVYSNSFGEENFNFNITEVEILEDGNVIKGLKKGTIKTNDGLKIIANTFTYNKLANTLTGDGDVEIIDTNKNIKIFSDNIIYKKNEEIINTNQNSRAIFDEGKFIFAENFYFDRNKNFINANGNVKVKNTIDNYLITGDDFTYYKNFKKIVTQGDTKAFIQSKYTIDSSNITYLIDKNTLISKNKTKIADQNSRVYSLENFNFLIDTEVLKGEKILIVTNYNLPKSDKLFLENAIIDLKDKKILAKNIEIDLHKSVLGNIDNDPRIKGVSLTSNKDTTTINKGIFTSCKKNDDCPPWSIKAEKIKHDKKKKQLVYDNAILKIYDLPVLYFPKFFHPDPSVKRQSGLLKPEINNSNVLGNSLTLPYYNVISDSTDLTFTPTVFSKDILMSVGEYRKINKKSKILADISFVDGYKSIGTNEKGSLSHLFLDYEQNLDFENYISSDLELSLEKVSNDKYLKIFDSHITKSEVRPDNFDKLNSSLKIFLNHEKFNFETGIEGYEDLQVANKSDRFQYILPYYNFDRSLPQDYVKGNFYFNSSGSNNLNDTNVVKSNIINNIYFNSYDYISNSGLKSNYGFNLQNLNSLGKKNSLYKSSPQIELAGLLNADFRLPLSKKTEKYENSLTPKLSFRFNPSDMKDYSTSKNKIDVNNIFALNRLGLSDTLEAGRSVTLGLDFKKENKNNLNEINNFFEMKLATVLRDKKENFISDKSSLSQKSSNLFGSITNKFSNNLDLGYKFSIDNDYNTFKYNDLNATISVNNFITTFNFIKENGESGNTNVISNSIAYNLDDKNFLKFQTRRNRRLNLTEYYDLVYEYKNDCLIAGIKYKKSYYEDGDLKPTENLLFTITLVPLTSYEYSVDETIK